MLMCAETGMYGTRDVREDTLGDAGLISAGRRGQFPVLPACRAKGRGGMRDIFDSETQTLPRVREKGQDGSLVLGCEGLVTFA